MLQLSRSHKQRLVLVLFALSLIPLLAKLWTPAEPNRSKNEKYSAELKKFSTLNQLIAYADATYEKNKTTVSFDTTEYALNLSEIIKKRFYHEDLKYSFSENWIAWLVGKTLWSHISFIVISDDILNHSEAICSQQTSVFMEILKKKGINVRSVGLGFDEGPGHYLCEVHYQGGWHLYDVSIEPDWGVIEDSHMSLDYYLTKKDLLYKAYEKRLPRPLFDKILERHSYGEVNKLPAKNMKLLHQTMNVCTYLLPVCLGLLLISLYAKAHFGTKQKEFQEEKEDTLILAK
ncbi:hypothetical protein CNR22_12520 [Sphingobacteriaceae bacterium]|nr:hypothetical protein CNR22_12520 [Sphingobacteriaceae bacterium]